MRNFFFILKSLCGGKSANTPPSEFSYASRVSTILKPLALVLLFVFAGVGNVWGANIVIDLDLTSTDTYPTGFPTTAGTASGTYSLGGYSFTISAPSSIYRHTTGNYLMLEGINSTNESTAACITFPAIANYKLIEVKVTPTSQGSTAVKLAIRSNYSTTLSGGGFWTYQQGTSNAKTWTLSGTAANTAYKLYVEKASGSGTKKCQLGGLKLTYEPVVSCSNKVTINAGTPETGSSFSLNKTGEQNCCDALTVTVSDIVAPSGKEFEAITQSGINTGVTIDQSAKTVTYAANSTGTSTINVTFRDLPKYSVTLKDNNETLTQLTAGGSVTLPSRAGCEGYTFAGWTKSWTEEQDEWTPTAPIIIDAGSYIPQDDENLYPVYTKTAEGYGFTGYNKVTVAPSDWSGKYLLSTGTYTATGVFDDSKHLSCATYSPSATEKTEYEFTITKVGTAGYSIKFPDGTNYLGYESSTNFSQSTTIPTSTSSDFLWTLSTSSINNVGTSNRKLSTNGANEDIRPYQNVPSGGTLISLYKRTEGNTSVTYYISVPNCCEALDQISGSVSLNNKNQRSITVNWTKPTTESDVDHYELSYKVKGSIDEPTVINNIANTDGSYTVSGLACSTTYEFILKAVGDASHCDYTSAAVEGTTLDALTLPALSYTTGLTAGGANINPIWATTPAHDGTVTYVSSNPSVLEVINASTGEVKPVGAGEATITATYAETASNCEASQTSNMVSVSGNVSVSFNANGGSGEMSNQSIQYNTATALTANGFTAPSCRYFYGWATSQENANNGVRAYTNGQEVTITEGMNLYAIWKVYNYNVVKGTGTGTESFDLSATSVDCGGSITVTATPDATHKGEPTITITPSNAGTVNGNTIENITANITAVDVSYAVKENYSVTWSVNGETVSKDFIEGTTFAAIMADASKPAVADNAIETNCEANKFMGWATAVVTKDNAESGDVAWFDGSAILSGAQTFYAVWAKEAIVPSNTYAAITSTSDLEDADYVIAYEYNNNGTRVVMQNEKDNGNPDTQLEAIELTRTNGKYNTSDGAYIWSLQAQDDGSYYIYNAATEKYLNATTSALTLSTTPTKYELSYDGTNSRWIIQIKGTTDYCVHGYVYGSSYDFRVSTDPLTNYNKVKYRTYFYKSEKETTYVNFITNCCGLKPVTGLTAGTVAATSVTLNWNAPESTEGITKLQVVNADNSNVLKDNIDKDATSAEVTGLETCTTYNLKVVSVGADCSSNSNIITATPQETAKTVTFKYNDDVTADVVASTTCEADYVTVLANPTRSGYRFMGWKNGDILVEGETFTPTAASTTINATWAQLYTVHYDFAGATFGEAPEDVQYIAGEEVILTDVVPNKGLLAPFKAWSFSTDVEVAAGKFNMPASDLTITATYNEIVGQWMLVTDESSLNVGDYVIIAAKSYDKAMKTTQNSTNYRYTTSITKDGSILVSPSDDVQIFVLEEGTVADSWAFKCLNGDYKDKYIYANSNSNNNYMNSQATNDANGSWKLNLVGGYATAQGTNKKKVLQYNDNRFTCYETASQSAIAFYQFREGVFYDVTLPEEVTGGSVSANTSMAKAGETVTLTYAPSRGYTVETLTVTGATSGEITISPTVEAGVTEYTFTMPAEAVTIAASFEAIPPVVYNLVESADDLAVGMQFLMVGAKSAGYEASGAWNSGGYLEAVNINAPSEKKISITTEAVEEIILEGESGAWLLVSDAGLLRESSKNLYTAGEPSKWTITITGGTATVHDGTYPLLYNASGSRFKTYDGTNDQIHAIALYALPYTTYNFTLSGCKTIKVATGYTYTYTIKSTDVPSETPDNCEFYAWTDGANYYRAGDPITVNAEITLTAVWKEILRGELYEGKWGTFCPQHEVRAFEGASFYTLTYLQMEAGMPYKLFFDEVETDYLEAGKPYLFIAEGEAIKGVKVGNEVATAANYNGFYGNVSGSTNTISTSQTEYQATGDIVNYYGLKNNTFTLLGNGTTVANERAVVQIKNGQLNCSNPPLHLAPARPGVRRVVASNSAPQIATGVDELNASETPVKMMIDGQLFILRGEKMYDATGRLVK